MKLRVFLTTTLIGALSLFACTHPQTQSNREPSSTENNYLRVATNPISADNTLVLIGIDRSISTDPNLKTVDATQQGFKSNQDVTHLEPKFLLTVSKLGIQQVYSFEIGKFYLNPNHSKPQLPYLLLDLSGWRKQLLARDPIEIGLQITNYIVSFLELKGIYDLWSDIGINHEGARRAQSSYLEQVISAALDQNEFPELMTAIPNANWHSEIEDLGSALAIRYHLNSLYTGMLQSSDPKKRDPLYRTLRANMTDSSDRQLSALDMRANAECLDVVRVSTTLAMLEFQKDRFKECVSFSGRRLDLKGNPQEIVDKIQDLQSDGDGRIPLALYILNDQDQFVELINFTNPDKLRDRDLLEKIHEVGLGVAELVMPGTVVGIPIGSLALQYVDGSLMFEVQKHGSTVLKQRVESYADMLMMMEAGLTTYNLDGFVKDAMIANLKNAKMPADELAQVQTGFASSDQKIVQRTMDDVMIFFGDREKGDRGFTGGVKQEAKTDQTRIDSWNRFAQWVSVPTNTAKLDQDLTKRTNKYEAKLAKQQAKQEAKAEAQAEAAESGKPTGNWFTRLFHGKKNAADPAENVIASPDTTHASASPSTIQIASQPDPNKPRPVILFMIDGFRPDRVHLAAERGQIPNIKARFIDKGVQLNSFTNYSVSLPSWTTVMTGFEPDRHGIHSSSTATRNPDEKTWTNLLDFRPDTHFYVFGKESRLYKRLVETNVKPIQEYIDPKQVLIATIPVSAVGSIPVGAAFKNLLTQYQRLAFGTQGVDPLIDLAGGNYVKKQIETLPGQHRFVLMWFGSVDHSAHADNHSMFDSYRAIDTAIGEVLAAAKKDPVLKDAVVLLVSDHGEMGGEEVADPNRKPIPDAFFLNNSTFNVMQFFTGDLPDSRDYNFVASSSKAEEPMLDAGAMGWMLNNVFEPYFFTGHGAQHNKGRKGYHNNTTILTEPFGDAMAHILFLEPGSRQDPARRLSYYQLRHYPAPTRKGVQLDIIHDLLEHSVYNTEFDDAIKERMKAFSDGNRAVKFLTIPLQGDAVRSSAEKITNGDPSKPPTRDPILVVSRGGKAALILTRDTDDGETSMRYVPIKNFDQAPDGTLSGQAVMDADVDPFGYISEGVSWDPLPWKTDREWLSLLQNTSYPTAVSSIPRKTTIHKDVASIPNLQDEIPDLEMESAYGFTFNSFQMHEGDHGGLTREAVRTSFFVSDDQMPDGLIHVATPIFNRDMGATVLDYLGATPAKGMSGRSMKPVIEHAVDQSK